MFCTFAVLLIKFCCLGVQTKHSLFPALHHFIGDQ